LSTGCKVGSAHRPQGAADFGVASSAVGILGGVSVLAALVDLVLPRRCVGCGSPLAALCGRCVPVDPVRPAGGGAYAAARYEGPVRAALLAYKERGRRDLAGPLAALLARAVAGARSAECAAPGRVVLVPVPSARAAVAARGGNHVLRLARRTAVAGGLRLAPDALVLTRAPHDSAGLRIEERAANLDHAMAARPAPPGCAALLVDDIVTTGATLREAGRALAAAGWPVAGAAVVAATPRLSSGASHPALALSR
jgi:predicted amidophosphoribosyltransferase